MISFEDRMALVRAGYTASQIAEFDKPQPEKPQPEKPQPEKPQPEKPQPEKPQPEKPHPEKPQPEQPHPEQPQPDFVTMMQSINNSMAAMLAAIQAHNIGTNNMPEPAEETPGEILAKLLNP